MKQYEKWMPLYIADYLADTSRLTLEQHGAYLLLIMDYWRNGAPPDDPVILARIVGASPEQWRAIAPVLHSLFHDEIRGGSKVWAHKRIDEELGRAKGISKIRAEVAANRHAKEHAKNMQLHTPLPSPSHIPSPEPLPAPKAKATPAARALPDWLPVEPWKAFLEMRAKIRAPLTQRGQELSIRKLYKLQASGEDVTAMLEQSVERSWRGLFPVKPNGLDGKGPPWWSSNEGIQAKAAELGVVSRGGESWNDLKARVNAALEAA